MQTDEYRANWEPILAIFIRNVASQSQFYTIRGTWVHRLAKTARFAVPHFVTRNDLKDILPFLPSEEVSVYKMDNLQPLDAHAPRDTGAKVMEQMRLFQEAADAVFRDHAARISSLYELIAPFEAFADRRHISLEDIAMKVLLKKDPSELTQPMLWTINRAISRCQNIVWDQLERRQNPMFYFYPLQGLKWLSQVREWVREYQEGIAQDMTNESTFSVDSTLMAAKRSLNPIATFVKKARAAVQQSRQTRPLSEAGYIGVSSIKGETGEDLNMPHGEIEMQTFDGNERLILHYFNVWTTSAYINRFTNLHSLGPPILRATGLYEGFELDEARGFTLLQELGVVTPWENRIVYHVRGLQLPGHYGGSGKASRLFVEASREAQVFEPKDMMKGLRRDWGDMRVFCIDSADTTEHDDGVSLELADDDPSAYWIHVHVANPSAFITPDSHMAKYAAFIAQSIYFPERKYAMLSTLPTKDLFSLANGRPCITFSAKISVDGATLEKKVTPGIVRNVHYLTPRMVSEGLGLTGTDEESETVSMFTVGGRMPTGPADKIDEMAKVLTDPGHIKALHKLLELGEANRRKRIQDWTPEMLTSAKLSAHAVVNLNQHLVKPFQINDRVIKQFKGDPTITVQKTTGAYSVVKNMVSDLMIIAGDVAASWCSERNIPIPYRGILRDPEPAYSPEAFKREVIDPKVAKYGTAERPDYARYQGLLGQAQVSGWPLEHFGLGLPAYCKTTSPLRRHVDMYTHWQIEAAIRHEAATGTSLVGNTHNSYLPFSRAEVDEYASSAVHLEKLTNAAKNASNRHWICQALFRAFHFEEASLPETFEVTINNTFHSGKWPVGWLVGWNLKVNLLDGAAVEKEGGRKIGDVWEAKLVEVVPYHKWVFVEPTRLLERVAESG